MATETQAMLKLSSAAVAKTRKRPASGLLHALGWVAAAAWSSQLLVWGSMIAVARLLSPSDLGLIAMANVFVGFTDVIGDCGLRDSVIALPDLTDQEVSQLNTVSVLLGIVLFAVSCAAAYPLETFFGAPHLHGVVIALSMALVLTAFRNIPGGLAYQEFRFKLVAQGRAGAALTTAVTTVAAALLGAGYWCLVIGSVAGQFILTLVILHARRHGFAWPNFTTLRRSLTLSSHIVLNRIGWYAYSNSDFLVAGSVLGQAALGSYSIAWSLSNRPVQLIADHVWQVLPSYLSNAQKDEGELRRYVLTISRAILLITLPASLGLSLMAKDIILATVGPKWISSVLPLRLLALYMPLSSITSLLMALMYVRGKSRFVMFNNIAAALYFPAAFYFASRWGTTGIAVVWPLLYPAVAVPLYIKCFKQINLPFKTYIDSLRPALTGSAVMTIGLLILRNAPPFSGVLYWHLAAEVITGATIYFITLVTLHRDELETTFTTLRRSRV
jgi:teichuronic acid exporter